MRYKTAGRDVVWEKFDVDYIVLDLSCGKYFSFSDSGNAVWEAIVQGVDVETVAATAAPWASSLPGFVNELINHKLIVPAEGDDAELAADLRERLVNATENASVSVFDDLADLFIADPIHDVEEETGWPVKKQAEAI